MKTAQRSSDNTELTSIACAHAGITASFAGDFDTSWKGGVLVVS